MTVSWRGPEGPGMYRENFQGLVDKLSKKYGVEKDKIFLETQTLLPMPRNAFYMRLQ